MPLIFETFCPLSSSLLPIPGSGCPGNSTGTSGEGPLPTLLNWV